MGSGFHATRIQGSCYNTVLSGYQLGQATAHIVWGVNDVAAPQTDITSGGCWYDSSHTSYPMNPLLKGKSSYAYGYMPQTGDKELPSEWHFDLAELDSKVGPYKISNPASPIYSRTIKGFRFKNSQCILPLVRKRSNKAPIMEGFTNVYWTDFYPQDPLQADIGNDWLGNIYNNGESPSQYMLHSAGVAEPFLGSEFYEDTETEIDKSKADYQLGFSPFCDPINIYNSQNTLIGKSDGMAFQLFIFNGMMKDRFKPVLNPTDPTKYLNTELQYWSIELWSYLSVTSTPGYTLKSPRLFTQRWWFYSQEGLRSGSVSPSDPYFFLINPLKQMRSIQFNLAENANNPLHTPTKVYDIPWSGGRVYLTA